MAKQKYPQTTVSTVGGEKVARKGRENYSHAKADLRKQRRRDQAEARQFKYDLLTTAEKLKGLGKTGSTRERARLEARLAKENPTAAKPADKVAKGVKKALTALVTK